MKGIIGKKVGMTQVYDAKGTLVPVTVIEAGPCVVTQKKTVETDGYNSLQFGFAELKEKKTNKPMKGHFEKAGVAPKKFLKEFIYGTSTSLYIVIIVSFIINGYEFLFIIISPP